VKTSESRDDVECSTKWCSLASDWQVDTEVDTDTSSQLGGLQKIDAQSCMRQRCAHEVCTEVCRDIDTNIDTDIGAGVEEFALEVTTVFELYSSAHTTRHVKRPAEPRTATCGGPVPLDVPGAVAGTLDPISRLRLTWV
jgi:hypothetical protein